MGRRSSRKPNQRLTGHGRGAAARAGQGDRAASSTQLRQHKILRGVRRLIQNQPDPGLLHPARLHRRAEAARRRTTSPSTSASSTITCRTRSRWCEQCPEVRFVLDHIGKPGIKAGIIDPWRQHMKELAALPERHLQDLRRHHRGRSQELDARAAEALHRARHRHASASTASMYGGDWHVLELAGTYPQWVEIVDWVIEGASAGREAQALPRQCHPLLPPRHDRMTAAASLAAARLQHRGDARAWRARALPRPVFDFADGGAEDERTLRRNEAAFDDIELLPRPLTGAADARPLDRRCSASGSACR